MKLTFEGKTTLELLKQVKDFINVLSEIAEAEPAPKVETPAPVVEAKPVEAKPKNKGGRPKGYSPKKNGAAAKVDLHKNAADKAKARAKIEAEKAAQAKPTTPPDEIEEPEQEVSFEDLELPQPEPEPEQLTPTQLAAIRVKTTEELQQAYAGGKHKQVLELLKKHGNGAKSFRELHIEDFVPIRKAIDDGALA